MGRGAPSSVEGSEPKGSSLESSHPRGQKLSPAEGSSSKAGELVKAKVGKTPVRMTWGFNNSGAEDPGKRRRSQESYFFCGKKLEFEFS